MASRWLNSVLGRSSSPRRAPTRRELLAYGSLSAAGLLLSSGARANASGASGRRVVVVGAGFAGLACAHELVSAGADVVVLEARDRIGGRVRSLDDLLPGQIVEAGGEFLGANHPTVQAYATMFGLELDEVPDEEYERPEPLMLDGRLLGKVEQDRLWEEVEATCEALTDAAREVVVDRPWETPNAAELDRTATSDWLSRQPISALAKRLAETQFVNDNAAPLDRQSLLGNLAQIAGGGLERYWTDTELFRCRGGNERFAAALARGIGAERIRLETPVVEIGASEQSTTAIDAAGRRYEADDLVLAAPPSTWRRIRFRPALPAELDPQMGAAVKFLTRVGSPFWKRSGTPPASLSDAGTGSVWLGACDEEPPNQRAALVGFVGGPAASEWSKRPPGEREREYVRRIETLHPGFAQAQEVVRFIDWIGDPRSAAGYSFPAPGQIVEQGPTLNEGLGRLRFAGEHACYKFVGYMEGALNSGASVAKRIVAS